MKKRIKLLAALFIVSALSFGGISVQAEESHDKMPQFKDVKLTEQQMDELKTLHEDVINKRKGVINKYVEFGVLSEEDGEKMKKHLDKMYEKLKEDGFVPKWDKHKHKKKGKE